MYNINHRGRPNRGGGARLYGAPPFIPICCYYRGDVLDERAMTT